MKNFIHRYRMLLTNDKNETIEKLFFSDFYLLPKDRKKILRFQLKKKNIPIGKYKVKLFAVESFGKESENFIEGDLIID